MKFQKLPPCSAEADIHPTGPFSNHCSLPLIFIFVAFLPVFFIGIVDLGWCSPYTRLYRENELTGGRGASLLPSLLLLLETEAGPAAQFSLFLGKVISTGGASPGLQDVVYLKKNWEKLALIMNWLKRFVWCIHLHFKHCTTVLWQNYWATPFFFTSSFQGSRLSAVSFFLSFFNNWSSVLAEGVSNSGD